MDKICWRGTDGDVQPIKCTYIDEFGYPNECINEYGNKEKMYDNTHFLNESDAWESIVKSIKASVSICDRFVKRKENEFTRAKEEAAYASVAYEKVRSNLKNPFKDTM